MLGERHVLWFVYVVYAMLQWGSGVPAGGTEAIRVVHWKSHYHIYLHDEIVTVERFEIKDHEIIMQ